MAQFKVIITDFGNPDNDLEAAECAASGLDIELVRLNAATPDELLPHVADADALIVQWCKITPAVMDAMQHCKVISRYGIGVDMVDLEAAGKRGIPVANVPDFCIEEVSTHTIGFVIALNRHMWLHDAHVRSGKWGGAPGGPPARLAGQTLGIVGLGNIGSMVAIRAAGLNLRLLGYDPYLPAARAAELGVALVSLDDLLAQSDYVTLHCPLIAETRHLIGAAQLACMKPTAYLINMARGPVVDQPALYDALTRGVIAGAAVDVLEQEPPNPADPLLQLPNIIITPHTSSWSADSLIQLRREAAANVVAVLKGGMARSIVNKRWLPAA
jgi:D-3-phosphoglycerate dehydrogenase / 2-oxoglutarate reductase